MAVTVSASLVQTFTGDPARPVGHAGWNNPYGDPAWVPDIDWYRRVQLICSGSAGEVGTTVNWEIANSTIQMKTNADLTTATAGAVASPYGTTINNKDTWTIWATTGVATAAQPKYVNTGTPVVSMLRANGPRVQVLLGKQRLSTGVSESFTVAAFLPGSGRVPSGTAAITVNAPVGVGQLMWSLEGGETRSGEDGYRVTFDLVGAPGATTWSFGDGTNSDQSDNHTIHYYSAPGTYTVTAAGVGMDEAYTVEVVIPEPPPPPEEDAPEESPQEVEPLEEPQAVKKGRKK